MRGTVRLALLSFMLATSFEVVAGDGNELLLACNDAITFSDNGSDFEDMRVGFCLGMVVGVRETSSLVRRSFGVDELLDICLPASVPNSQVVRVVTKYLKENPSLLHKSDSYLTFLALQDSFPCSN